MDGNQMNWNNNSHVPEVTLERIKSLELRIEALESTIKRYKDCFFEEDLKARGLQ